MIVVVSGFGRCGSSLMMRMLASSGYPLFYDRFLELSLRGLNRDDYLVNESFYECRPRETQQFGFTRQIKDGMAVKIPFVSLGFLSGGHHPYSVIIMHRDAKEIRESFRRAMPGLKHISQQPDWESQYRVRLDESQRILAARKDVQYVVLDFKDLVHNPVVAERALAGVGVSLSSQALGLIDPSLYRCAA